MKTKERIKTILLIVLICGAFFLTYSIWFYDTPSNNNFISNIIWNERYEHNNETISEVIITEESTDVFPFAISYRNDKGRFGAAYHAGSVFSLYDKTSEILRRALTEAADLGECKESEWQSALVRKGILYDFEGNVSLMSLADTLGIEKATRFSQFVRYIVLLPDRIYFKNSENGEFYRAKHTISQHELMTTCNEMSAAQCLLAVEANETRIAGETPIFEGNISSFVVNGQNPFENFEENQLVSLLKIFGMNYNTCGKHTEQDGTHVYIEDLNILKVASDGYITYTSENKGNGIVISDAGSTLTQDKALAVSEDLIAQLLQFSGGDSKMYLRQLRRENGKWIMRYGQSFGGIPIDRQKSGHCAQIEISGNRVTQIEFYMRSYNSAGSVVYTIPQKLAVASLGGNSRAVLSLRYTDGGGSGLEAQWYAKLK